MMKSRVFLEMVNESSCAFLCGAGVSVPSGLPDAATFVRRFISYLTTCAHSAILPEKIIAELNSQRLEWILQVVSQVPGASIPDILREFNHGIPNDIHAFIVQGATLASNDVGLAMTTNFDGLLERAGADCGVQFNVVTNDAVSVSPKVPDAVLANLHGSLSASLAQGSLRATLNGIGKYFLPTLDALLKQLLQGRTIIVLGYSGNDHYDVMPLLYRHALGGGRILWVQHDSNVPADLVLPEQPPKAMSALFGRRSSFLRANTPMLAVHGIDHFHFRRCQSTSSDAGVRRETTPTDTWHSITLPVADVVLAELTANLGHYENALHYFQSAMEQIDFSKNPSLWIKVNRGAAAMMSMCGDGSGACHLVDSVFAKKLKMNPEEKVALMTEYAWGLNTESRWSGMYANAAMIQMMKADEAAEKINSPRMRSFTQSGLAKLTVQMVVNGELQQDAGYRSAADAYGYALQLRNDNGMVRESLAITDEAVHAFLSAGRFRQASMIAIKAAVLQRMFSYQDDGATFRLAVITAALVAAVAEFMDEETSKTVKSYSVPLLAVGALQEFMSAYTRALDLQLNGEWRDVSSNADLYPRVMKTAQEWSLG